MGCLLELFVFLDMILCNRLFVIVVVFVVGSGFFVGFLLYILVYFGIILVLKGGVIGGIQGLQDGVGGQIVGCCILFWVYSNLNSFSLCFFDFSMFFLRKVSIFLFVSFSIVVFSRLIVSVRIFVLSFFRFFFLGAVFIGINSCVFGWFLVRFCFLLLTLLL